MIKTIITAIPQKDNAGNSTLDAATRFYGALRAQGIAYTISKLGEGLWYGDDGTLYRDAVNIVHLTGDVDTIRAIVGRFGEDTAQLAMLFVERAPGHIVDAGHSLAAACALAHKHGGATWLPELELAVTYRYSVLKAGYDYALDGAVKA